MTEITRRLDAMNEPGVELIHQLLMDNDLTALHAQAARTDRLVGTPTPVSYSRHISRGLVLWLLALPAVYASACPIWNFSPPASRRVAAALGIDDIGMQLEQPYTVMSIRQFCQECEEEVKREMGESAWTPRIGKPREDVLESDFLNPEMTEFEKAGKRRRASVSREEGERGAGMSEAKRSRERRAGGDENARGRDRGERRARQRGGEGRADLSERTGRKFKMCRQFSTTLQFSTSVLAAARRVLKSSAIESASVER